MGVVDFGCGKSGREVEGCDARWLLVKPESRRSCSRQGSIFVSFVQQGKVVTEVDTRASEGYFN